jgi:hypothetical protein
VTRKLPRWVKVAKGPANVLSQPPPARFTLPTAARCACAIATSLALSSSRSLMRSSRSSSSLAITLLVAASVEGGVVPKQKAGAAVWVSDGVTPRPHTHLVGARLGDAELQRLEGQGEAALLGPRGRLHQPSFEVECRRRRLLDLRRRRRFDRLDFLGAGCGRSRMSGSTRPAGRGDDAGA